MRTRSKLQMEPKSFSITGAFVPDRDEKEDERDEKENEKDSANTKKKKKKTTKFEIKPSYKGSTNFFPLD